MVELFESFLIIIYLGKLVISTREISRIYNLSLNLSRGVNILKLNLEKIDIFEAKRLYTRTYRIYETLSGNIEVL